MPQKKNLLRIRKPRGEVGPCQWFNKAMAFRHFAIFPGKTESAKHIKPLHWYIACRLVLEGGFDPDDITPRPPFDVRRTKNKRLLSYNPSAADGRERTLLGGLKTKDVDVVVTRSGIGPVLAISCKGSTRAFRNLTNRLEETVGECTNLHITYPAMTIGYVALLRANRDIAARSAQAVAQLSAPSRKLKQGDMAFRPDGSPVEGIVRFHAALREMTGRRGIRDDVSRYEAMCISLLEVGSGNAGEVFAAFPPEDSPLRWDNFFKTLYARYDERFVISAPKLAGTTRRQPWSAESPALIGTPPDTSPSLDYEPLTASEPDEDEASDEA